MKIKIFVTQLIVMSFMLLLQSCQGYSDGRMLKKFISRLNAKEYASAASYVYPEDRMNVAFFANEVKSLAPHAFIELEDYDSEESGEGRYIHATLKWKNSTPALKNYFQNIGYPIDADGKQTIVLNIKETTDGETLAFPFGIPNVHPEDLRIAKRDTEDESKKDQPIKYYSSPSSGAKTVSNAKKLIVGPEGKSGWRPVYKLTKEGDPVTYYIPQDSTISYDGSAFFHLGIFDSVGVIVAFIVIILIIVPFLLLRGVIESIFTSSMYGPIIVVAIILGALYVVYQLIEQIVFELFIINLPY